jgi:hypothetical protein
MKRHSIKVFEDFWAGLKQESDLNVLKNRYKLYDNLCIKLVADETQKAALEAILETYPKKEDFKTNLKMFGVRYYCAGNLTFGYRVKEGFESLTFYAGHVSKEKMAVIEIIEKILALKIPFNVFECVSSESPVAAYRPK